MLRSTNIQDGKLVLDNPAFRAVSEKTAAKYTLARGDILVTTSSGSARLLGKNAIVEDLPGHGGTYLFSNFTWRLRPDQQRVAPKFLYYFLNSSAARAELGRIQSTTSGLKNLNTKLYVVQPIPLPPLSEQRRIVEILDQADRLCRLRAEADAKAERVLPALFIRMFGDPATNPMGWELKPLGQLATDLRYGTSMRCHTAPVGVPVLRIPNIVRGHVDTEELKYCALPVEDLKRFMLGEGDVLFVRTNGNPDYVGRCAVFEEDQAYSFASYLIRVRLNREAIDPRFVTAFLQTPLGRRAMAPFIRTTAGQSNINTAGLRQILVPMPPMELQRRFHNRLDDVKQLDAKRQNVSAQLGDLFTSLLYRGFIGDLTTAWREAHMEELLQEMEQQAKTLAHAETAK